MLKRYCFLAAQNLLPECHIDYSQLMNCLPDHLNPKKNHLYINHRFLNFNQSLEQEQRAKALSKINEQIKEQPSVTCLRNYF